MAVRRWIDLSRYDGAQMLIAAECPPDGTNRLVVRNYSRSDLAAHGFRRIADGLWIGSSSSFKVGDLKVWFPGFDPARDIREIDTAAFLVGYEDLDVASVDFEPDELIAPATELGNHPSQAEQARRARAEATPEQIAAVTSSFPSGAALLAETRSITDEVLLVALAGVALPDDPDQRANAMRARVDRARETLTALTERYEEILSRGLDAISDYDILIAFQGNALFALRGSLNYQRSLINDHLNHILALSSAATELESAAADLVGQFGVAMRNAGLEMDGLDPRSWSLDIGGGHEVHAMLAERGAIQLRRLAGEVWFDEWEGPFSDDAASRVQELVRRALHALPTPADEETTSEVAQAKVEAMLGRVRRFASGMSRAKDFHPVARAEHGIGVDVGELSDTGMRDLADRIVHMRAQVFVDSGAFGLFKRGIKGGEVRPMDFDAVLAKYEQLQQYIAEANVAEETLNAPMLVMPDVVGDQAASLELVAKYRDWIKVEAEFQVSRPVVPLQSGDISLIEAYAKVVKILGTDRFVVGIPSNAAAIAPNEFIAFLRECKPRAVHILGALADSRLTPRLQQIVQAGVDADIEVSADANILRSKILTRNAPSGSRAERIEQVLSQAAIAADQESARLYRARAVKNPERMRERIEDAGEKIGGARKDFSKSALRIADLADMNERERAECVTKDNVWPSRAISDYREAGVDARVALFLQYLRREFPAKPGKPELAEAYVELIQKLQEVMLTCRTYDDIESFDQKLAEAEILCISKNNYGKSTSMEDRFNDVLYGSLNRAWPYIQRYFFDTPSGYRRAQQSYRGKLYQLNGEEVRAGDLDSDGFYDLLSALKERTIERQKQSRENRSSDDPDKAALARPHLAKIIRDGIPDERSGKDITGDDLLSDFGFRACEFGNWLPDTERQEVLNRAHDAFTSLSRILGVPKRALSLNGSLAIAFGSRGAGRSSAHYECSRKVINLTRLRGAGSLAHEWWHALDDFVGEKLKEMLGDSPARRTVAHLYFASDMVVKRYTERRGGKEKFDTYGESWRLPGNAHDMVPLIELANAIGVRPWSREEVLRHVTSEMMGHERRLLETVAKILGNIRPDEQIDVIRRQARRMVEQVRAAALNGERISRGAIHPLEESLRGTPSPHLDREKTLQHRFHIGRLSSYVADYLDAFDLVQDENLRDASEHARRRTYTKYAADAKHFDAKRSDQYWSVMHELSARAFESYVQDSLGGNGWRDDYLVHGTEEDLHEHRVHSAYPMGEDRTSINKAMAKCIDLFKDKFSDVLEPNDGTASSPRLRVA